MASRRDLLHAYQFMMQRVISAVVVRETDPEQAPLRRGVGAAFAGVMIAVLIAAGFGVYGVFTGIGGDGWQADGAVIVEQETGAVFVYRDGSLHPALNLASARLVSGASGGEVHTVAGKSLRGVPREVPVGIPGAPQSLPPVDRAVRGPWTICSSLVPTSSGSTTAVTSLVIGRPVAGGDALAHLGLLVRDADDGVHYLLWNNHRYRIAGPDPASVIRSLYGMQRRIREVGSAWLNGLPSGEDIGPIAVDGLGAPSTAVPGYDVGDFVYHAVGVGEQYYLVLTDGLAPLTVLQRRVFEGQYASKAKEISASLANEVPTRDVVPPPPGDLAAPARPPRLVTDNPTSVCAKTSDGKSTPTLSLVNDRSLTTTGVQTSVQSSLGTKLADRVRVPPGSVAIVRAMPSKKARTGALYLVTDTGVRFAVPSADVLATLGYSEDVAVRMPAALVQRIPAGPTLDPSAAMRAVDPQVGAG